MELNIDKCAYQTMRDSIRCMLDKFSYFLCFKIGVEICSRHFYQYVYSFKVLLMFLVLSMNNILLFALKERIKTCSNSFQAFGMLNGRDLQKKINLLRF